ncbi:MAG: ribosomal protein S18-alanine N-acetyltransferase [Eubacteriales bacterium]|jgi:ribosomal-protein-alanine N-acetyltransferase
MMEIVRFGLEHIQQAAQIETLCFSDPWSNAGLEFLTGEMAVSFACMVDGRLAAYAGMLCVLDEGQILNVATHPNYRRRGYARALLGALIGYADSHGIVTLSLEVRESNTPAISLYRSAGFVTVGYRPRYYHKPVEAAVIMVRTKNTEVKQPKG